MSNKIQEKAVPKKRGRKPKSAAVVGFQTQVNAKSNSVLPDDRNSTMLGSMKERLDSLCVGLSATTASLSLKAHRISAYLPEEEVKNMLDLSTSDVTIKHLAEPSNHVDVVSEIGFRLGFLVNTLDTLQRVNQVMSEIV